VNSAVTERRSLEEKLYFEGLAWPQLPNNSSVYTFRRLYHHFRVICVMFVSAVRDAPLPEKTFLINSPTSTSYWWSVDTFPLFLLQFPSYSPIFTRFHICDVIMTISFSSKTGSSPVDRVTTVSFCSEQSYMYGWMPTEFDRQPLDRVGGSAAAASSRSFLDQAVVRWRPNGTQHRLFNGRSRVFSVVLWKVSIVEQLREE
jgi:hypothetical protein